YHPAGIGRLFDFAIDATGTIKIAGIYFCGDHRSDRAKSVKRLCTGKLAVAPLKITGGYIIEANIAMDKLKRICGVGNIFATT
ncbi:hypothetical protein OFB62_29135, partial [Escherichia coli]|nr:hypothetical protein [Escherichia coli]